MESADRLFKGTCLNFKQRVESFKTAYAAIPKNKRTIGNRYESVKTEYNTMILNFKELIILDPSASSESHPSFCAQKELSLLYDEIESLYDAYQDELEDITNKRDACKLLDEKVLSGTRRLNSSIKRVREVLVCLDSYLSVFQPSSQSRSVLREYKSNIEDGLQLVSDELFQCMSVVPDENYSNLNRMVDECFQIYSKSKPLVLEYISVDEVSANGEDVSSISFNNGKNFSKLKKLDPPLFDNSKRSYARFKSDFARIVSSELEPTYQAIYLRSQCTSGRAKKLIENVDGIDNMWNILDQEYGRPEQLVHEVTERIRKLTVLNDGDTHSFINFVDVLKSGLVDLQLIKAEDAMSNPMTIREIESRLPENLALKWSEHVNNPLHGIDMKNKLFKLMNFLETERTNASYRLHVMGRDPKSSINKNDAKVNSYKPTNSYRDVGNSKGRFNSSGVEVSHKCLNCKSDHTITRRCPIFHQLSLYNKKKVLLDNKACFLCFQSGHSSDSCEYKLNNKWQPCKHCSKWHANTICDKYGKTGSTNTTTDVSSEKEEKEEKVVKAGRCGSVINSNDGVLLPIQPVKLYGIDQMALCLWDTGATGALINDEFAAKNGIKGSPVNYALTAVDGSISNISGQMYIVKLVDIQGHIHMVNALGIKQISSVIYSVGINDVIQYFNGVKFKDIERHSGKLDLLIGEQYAGMHPIISQRKDNLVLRKSMFGSGWLLSGTHPSLRFPKNSVSVSINYSRISDVTLIGLLSADNLGIDVPSRCFKCKNCANCSHYNEMVSVQEQYENDLIDEGLKYDPEKQKCVASYPYCQSPHKLVNNKTACMKIFANTEKRLSNNFEFMQKYNQQFDDMIRRNVLVELSEEYISNWQGPVFYLPHHAVIKASSLSTPVRIVFNSAFKDINGRSLNECLFKGQNVLNNLLHVILRFREHLYVAVGDLSKMFHSILTTETEWNLHRLLYRELGSNERLKTMAITCVCFGDRPAPAIAVSGLRKTMLMFREIDPEVSDQIINDSYMDDCVIGAESCTLLDTRTKSAEVMVKRGGFSFKEWNKVGDSTDQLTVVTAIDHDKLLGLSWDKFHDTIHFNVRINFSKQTRCHGKQSEDDIEACDFEIKFPKFLTKRNCLAITNALYDPIGLIQPFVIKLKLALRDIIVYSKTKSELNWDDHLPAELYDIWYKLVESMFGLRNLCFDRKLTPFQRDPDELPWLITFSDGSIEALSSVCYIRWKLSNGEFWTNIVIAKSKLAPLVKLTVPRIELLSAVMNVRLTQKVENSFGIKIGKKVHIIDSKIVLAMVHTISICYGEYVGSRIAEIQRKSSVNDWYWTDSTNNISDMGTRRTTAITDLNYDSSWQRGPEWLLLEFEKWPINQDFDSNVTLPELKKSFELYNISCNFFSHESSNLSHTACNNSYVYQVCGNVGVIDNCTPESLFQVGKYSDYKKLLRVTAYVFKFIFCLKNKCVKSMNSPLTYEDVEKSEQFWLMRINLMSLQSYNNGQFKPLCPSIVNGVVVIAGRAGQEAHQYNIVDLPILDSKHPVTKLYVLSVHNIHHCGIDQTVAYVRLRYWVPKCRKIAKYIKQHCMVCRKLDAIFCKQKMATLPDSRLKPGPVWTHTALDLFGPIEIKDSVKKRVKGKAWGVIFTCHASRAIFITTTEDYSTDSFLQTLQRFVNRHGCPKFLYSDKGSQLVGASNEMKTYFDNLEEARLHHFATESGFTWIFAPTKAPWYSGVVERLVGITKKQLKLHVHNRHLTFGELETVFSSIEYIINSRPLFRYPESDPLDRVGTPLDLIMGRNDRRPPVGIYEFNSNLTRRCRFQQQIVRDFWNKWKLQVFHSLVPFNKWRKEYRNVSVGDIVHMYDTNSSIGSYRLGIIDSVKLDSDNLVRRVIVKYKLPSDTHNNCFKYSERAVQNLVIIIPNEESNISSDSSATIMDVPSCSESLIHNNSSSKNDVLNDGSVNPLINVSSNKSGLPSKFTNKNSAITSTSSGRIVKVPKKLDL